MVTDRGMSSTAINPLGARHTQSIALIARPAVEMHPAFAAALKKNKRASAIFKAFSPTNQREYLEWIAEAKRDETRETRIATAVDWLAEGKRRNWKHESR